MKDKEYDCAYKFCLHRGEKVNSFSSVVINKKHYHWDCAAEKQAVKECVDIYMEYTEDKSQYPVVFRTINTLIYKNRIPIDYIKNNLINSEDYYRGKPIRALYGLRKMFWEYEMKT